MRTLLKHMTSLVAGLVERALGLRKYAKDCGYQRATFLKALSENGPILPYTLVTKYGSQRVAVNMAGDVVTVDDGDGKQFQRVGLHPDLSSIVSKPGSAPANKKIGKIIVPCGVCLIIGGGGTGKTPLAHALAAHGVQSYGVVRVGEPLAGYCSDPFETAYMLGCALIQHSDVVLDSIKDLLSGGGAAMKSGISRDALVSISSWATMAAEAGSTIYVPLNPSTDDVEVIKILVEAAKSNATMTVFSNGGASWRYEARTGEGQPRSHGSLALSFDRSGVPVVKVESIDSKTPVDDAEGSFLAMDVTASDMANAIRRATSALSK